jgi:hypothetical protein
MKKTLIIAMAATGLALAGPVAAHHNIPDEDQQDFVAGQMSVIGLDSHNEAVVNVLDRLDQDFRGAMEGSRSTDMDPANDASGAMCTDMLLLDECAGGNVNDRGMDRGPTRTDLPVPVPVPVPEM